MDFLITVFTSAIIVALVTLLGYLVLRRTRFRMGWRWLAVAIVLALVVVAVELLPADFLAVERFSPGLIRGLALASMLVTYGVAVVRDVTGRGPRWWAAAGILWLMALLAAALLTGPGITGQPEWLLLMLAAPDPFGLVLLAGIAALTLALLGVTFYGFYVAALPEVANRALFWVLDVTAVMLASVLLMSGTPLIFVLGTMLLVFGFMGALYAAISYRLFDIRTGMSRALRTLLRVGYATLIIFAVLYLASGLNPADQTEQLLLLALLAVMAAALYVVSTRLAVALVRPLLPAPANPTKAARLYSQQVSKAVELDQLVQVASITLNNVMGVRRSGMLLVNDTSAPDGWVELLVMKGPAFTGGQEVKGRLVKTGPIYHQLAAQQAPMSQFDLEYSPAYQSATPPEREFFRGLGMSAYAPITVDDVLIGILMCGARINDAPFYPRDLELLATMADQTGVALRNARLVADLRHLNATMRALNNGLEEANEQLEKLDSVKTDFITIASHELRTPLAQVRGYTDILDALNEQGLLDKDQISGMVSNLRKATERTEDLIGAMLDVSQLDVNAMDLRFTQTAPESIIRMAIEPLTDALNQRKLSLAARGLRGLPPIYADMQRLVQAFRNIVLNAIKFTPDGGRIEITASLQAAPDEGETDQVMIVISDTGVGIEKANLELIFEKFYRAYDPSLHSTGMYKFLGAGPGLGLTIARGVIEGHGGKIWAESSGHNMETCPGSTFYVLLPVVPPEDARRVSFEESPSDTARPSA